ncbi:hypothetical protein BH24BAC1_BH24BAC1_04140 [soil metagenome]
MALASPPPQFPENSLILESLPRVEFADAFSASFRSRRNVPAGLLLPLFFKAIPAPARWLLAGREVLARLVGLKTAQGRRQVEREIRRFRGQVGDRIALFEVLAASPIELLTGMNDQHLDFRLSLRLQRLSPDTCRLWLLTQVQTHNRLGRTYMAMVKPVHRWLMQRVVRNMALALER